MIRTAIIIASTRPNRKGESVGRWAYEVAKTHGGAEYELVDIRDFNLPLLDEPQPAATGQYTKEHTKKWSAKIASFDAFVFVVPEYNHLPPPSLTNAIDFLYQEWTNKAAGFVGYGGNGALRSVEALRLMMGMVQIADVQSQVALSLRTDFEGDAFKPQAHQEKGLKGVLDQVTKWGVAMRSVRGLN